MNAAKRVLVVDDDADFSEQVGLVLTGEGYDVVTANGQGEAEEKLLAMRPDICVVDLMMEHHDSGFVLCHEIKRLHPGTPVILLTGVRSSTGLDFTAWSSQAASWIEADAFLDKPVRPEQLRAEVAKLLAAGG